MRPKASSAGLVCRTDRYFQRFRTRTRSISERTMGCSKSHEGWRRLPGQFRLPFSSISIVQIITSHQYAMISSIILVIVWLIFSSPLLMKIAKYLLLCMKLRDYCTISNLVHQASITYPGGFITTALMRLPMWLHIIFWICPFPAALAVATNGRNSCSQGC